MSENVRIALQRAGRLAEGSLNLLERCGIKVSLTKNKLLTEDEAFGLEFIFARDDDIPGIISNQLCDIGIIGSNLLAEHREAAGPQPIEIIAPLGFSRCRLCLAGPRNLSIKSIRDLAGHTIATSYPKTTQKFLHDQGVEARLVVMHGSVELAPQIGIGDLICDIVSSGATLHENGLVEYFEVLKSEALLVGTSGRSPAKQSIVDRLLLRIRGVQNASRNRYIMLHIDRSKLPLLRKLLPGTETPTILELQGLPEKVAVHAVSQEEVFWETIEKLRSIGATSILVLPIEKMLP